MSGSIRTPDRLHAADIIKSDICDCRACMGARATADHIFWDCRKYDDTRATHMLKIQHLKQQCAKDDNTTYQQICQYMELPRFRNCGILIETTLYGRRMPNYHKSIPTTTNTW